MVINLESAALLNLDLGFLARSSGVTVSNVQIIRNTICSSANALRIKTVAAATRSTVSDITYINNTAYDISKYGVIIDQSYPTTNGAP